MYIKEWELLALQIHCVPPFAEKGFACLFMIRTSFTMTYRRMLTGPVLVSEGSEQGRAEIVATRGICRFSPELLNVCS